MKQPLEDEFWQTCNSYLKYALVEFGLNWRFQSSTFTFLPVPRAIGTYSHTQHED